MESFLEKIREVTGCAPTHEALVPGKMIRFATSDRKGDLSGWCKLFEDECGVFGCWRQGISDNWQSRKDRSPEEQAVFLERVKQAKAEAASIEAELRAKCREKSAKLWEKGRDVEARHHYLATKNIKPHAIRQLGRSLMVPVRDINGVLHGLQFIMPDGAKRFKSGTAVTGCYHAIGKPNGKILIAEGFATGATLHEITGHAVACAFSAGNLKPVSEALRRKYPDTLLVLCADDDHLTEGNPGLTKATEAAQSISGLLATPRFPATRKDGDTDYNDLARMAEPEAVAACIEVAAVPADEIPLVAESSPPDYQFDAVIQRLSKLSPF
jgi:putative DNA primase/helicase